MSMYWYVPAQISLVKISSNECAFLFLTCRRVWIPFRRVHYAILPSNATAPNFYSAHLLQCAVLSRAVSSPCCFVAVLFCRVLFWRRAVLAPCSSVVCGFVAVRSCRCAVLTRAVLTRALLTPRCYVGAILSRAVSSRAVLSVYPSQVVGSLIAPVKAFGTRREQV